MLAQEEARLLNHSFIGTEHILLGLIHEGEGVAAKALESLGISLEAVREKVEETIGMAGTAPTRLAAVHPAGEEGPRALAARGAAARPQLHRDRAHAARSRPRGRGRGRPGAREPRRRPRPRAPAGHPADVGLPGQGVGRREPGRELGRQPVRLAGARPVRPQPHRSWPATASSTRSSGARKRSSASCRCCRAARRTTRCSSASPASARPPSSRAWPSRSWPTTCPRR